MNLSILQFQIITLSRKNTSRSDNNFRYRVMRQSPQYLCPIIHGKIKQPVNLKRDSSSVSSSRFSILILSGIQINCRSNAVYPRTNCRVSGTDIRSDNVKPVVCCAIAIAVPSSECIKSSYYARNPRLYFRETIKPSVGMRCVRIAATLDYLTVDGGGNQEDCPKCIQKQFRRGIFCKDTSDCRNNPSSKPFTTETEIPREKSNAIFIV